MKGSLHNFIMGPIIIALAFTMPTPWMETVQLAVGVIYLLIGVARIVLL